MRVKRRKRIVFMVEKSLKTLHYLRGSLGEDYEVLAVRSEMGQGLGKIKKLAPSLVICDFGEREPFEFKEWRKLKKDVRVRYIPMLMLCGKLTDVSIVRMLDAGVESYMPRPIDMKILAARVKNMIYLREQIQQHIQSEILLWPSMRYLSPADEAFVKTLRAAVEKNVSNPLFGVKDLNELFFMSRSSFFRRTVYFTGLSPQLYLRSFRMKEAARLLRNYSDNITEVCFKVGFTSTAYFTKCFKKEFGCSPIVYREKIRKSGSTGT